MYVSKCPHLMNLTQHSKLLTICSVCALEKVAASESRKGWSLNGLSEQWVTHLAGNARLERFHLCLYLLKTKGA